MDVYAENILDHYRDPRNAGPLEGASVTWKEDNPSCGDEITINVLIENDAITKISWEGVGCAISLAGMSMLSEELEGMSTTQVLELSKQDIYELLGVPIGPRRFKCALIGLHTMKNALRKYNNEPEQSWVETVGL